MSKAGAAFSVAASTQTGAAGVAARAAPRAPPRSKTASPVPKTPIGGRRTAVSVPASVPASLSASVPTEAATNPAAQSARPHTPRVATSKSIGGGSLAAASPPGSPKRQDTGGLPTVYGIMLGLILLLVAVLFGWTAFQVLKEKEAHERKVHRVDASAAAPDAPSDAKAIDRPVNPEPSKPDMVRFAQVVASESVQKYLHERAPQPSKRPVLPDAGVTELESDEEGIAVLKGEYGPVLVMFSNAGCGTCASASVNYTEAASTDVKKVKTNTLIGGLSSVLSETVAVPRLVGVVPMPDGGVKWLHTTDISRAGMEALARRVTSEAKAQGSGSGGGGGAPSPISSKVTSIHEINESS